MKYENVVFEIPQNVLKICELLNASGERGYVVGGAIRDLLLGKEVQDFDLATTATPECVMTIFHRVIPTGVEHGTVSVLMGEGVYELTTLRKDADYSDGRRPDAVEYVSEIDEDLARRDFTINAMAYDPLASSFHDPFEGRIDLEKGVVRAVGAPLRRFAEDGLRIMRAARFCAVLDFELDEPTRLAMVQKVTMLENVSTERVRDEFFKTLTASAATVGMNILMESGAMRYVHDDIYGLKAPKQRWEQCLQRICLCQPVLHLRMTVLLYDVAELAPWMTRFLVDTKTKRSVLHLSECLRRWEYASIQTPAQMRALAKDVQRANLDDFFHLLEIVETAANNESSHAKRISEGLAQMHIEQLPLCVKELAVDGNTLMNALERKGGKWLGSLLDELLNVVIEHPELNTRDQLLAYVRTNKTDLFAT